MKLNQLADNPGARKKRKRKARGIGSGTGKTAGRGIKGQKSRSGVAIGGFEGGQMPLHMRLPKRGFTGRPKKLKLQTVNLRQIEQALNTGKLDPNQIDRDALIRAGLIKPNRAPAKILGKGELTYKIRILAHAISSGALHQIERLGGQFVRECKSVFIGVDDCEEGFDVLIESAIERIAADRVRLSFWRKSANNTPGPDAIQDEQAYELIVHGLGLVISKNDMVISGQDLFGTSEGRRRYVDISQPMKRIGKLHIELRYHSRAVFNQFINLANGKVEPVESDGARERPPSFSSRYRRHEAET